MTTQRKPNTTEAGELACAMGTAWQADHTACCLARLEADLAATESQQDSLAELIQVKREKVLATGLAQWPYAVDVEAQDEASEEKERHRA